MLFFFPISFGQEINIDTALAEIRQEAEKGNYDKALLLIEPLLVKFPENEEVKIFAGRIYSWKKDYKKSNC